MICRERKREIHGSMLSCILLALAGVAVPRLALAQDGYYGPEKESDSVSDCSPPCRPGFFCAQGVCISPCSPPCSEGEVCLCSGKCIPASPASSVDAGTPRPQSASASGRQRSQRPEKPAFDTEMYEGYKRNRYGGAVAMVFGAITICAAIGMGFTAGLIENETLLFVGIGVEVAGDLMFFPGLGAWIKGKRGMDRMERSRAGLDPRHTRSGPALGDRAVGLVPMWSLSF